MTCKINRFYFSVVIYTLLVRLILFVSSEEVCKMNTCNALEKARELGRNQPSRQLKKGGEFEGINYWEEHESLLSQAWSELPHLHPELYNYNDAFQEKFINLELRQVVKKLKELAAFSRPNFVDESDARDLVTDSDVVKDVFYIGKADETTYGLFTMEFSKLLLEELDHLSNSGIPMRRPNGMNRYGAILGNYYIHPKVSSNNCRFNVFHTKYIIYLNIFVF
jgi:hypothetical protein